MGTLNGKQEGATGKNTESKFVNVLGGAAAIACLLVCFFYVVNFSGGISSSTTRWSEFGGYLSGVLLPVISFLTLAAILRTIYLQREMIKLQDETFKAQATQSNALADDYRQARLDARKTMLLNNLDRTINTCIRDIERLEFARNEAAKSIILLNAGGGLASDELLMNLEQLRADVKLIEWRKNKLESLSYLIAVMEQLSIEELQENFNSGMINIYGEPMR